MKPAILAISLLGASVGAGCSPATDQPAKPQAAQGASAPAVPNPEGAQPPMPREGMGSGFIVDANGVILTNAHVVEGADEVRVKLADRREFKGKVAGLDHTTDIAVVKIDAKDLPTVKLGDASKVRV